MFGVPIAGGAAGHGLGAAISKWLGAGDYTVTQNSLVNSVKASGNIPMMHTNDQSVIVRHKEFVCEVRSSSLYTIQKSLTINPGNSELFPWLSSIASSYQQYKLKGMVYHYVPTSGSATGANTALGSVMMQTSYRSNDSPPSNKIEMLNEYWSTEAMPSESFCHPIECNPAENPFNVQYVRSSGSTVPAQDSPLLYDLGKTYLATSGQQTTDQVLGDLWVTYEVELKKPIVGSNVTHGDTWVAGLFQPSAVSNDNPFAGASSTLGNFTFSTTTSRGIVLPPYVYGVFWIFVRLAASGSPFVNPVMTGNPAITDCTLGVVDGAATTWNTSISNSGNTQIVHGLS